MTLFGLLAATGMRLAEALRLERKDLNLDKPSLTVRATKGLCINNRFTYGSGEMV